MKKIETLWKIQQIICMAIVKFKFKFIWQTLNIENMNFEKQNSSHFNRTIKFINESSKEAREKSDNYSKKNKTKHVDTRLMYI